MGVFFMLSIDFEQNSYCGGLKKTALKKSQMILVSSLKFQVEFQGVSS
jgi:hypothetical protein